MCWFTVVASSSRRVLQSLLDNMIVVVPLDVVVLLLLSAHSAITIRRPSDATADPSGRMVPWWFTLTVAPDRFLHRSLLSSTTAPRYVTTLL